MKVGNLVKITRASIGVPAGTLGLIVESYGVQGDYDTTLGEKIHILQLIGVLGALGYPSERRYLPRDLEVVSG